MSSTRKRVLFLCTGNSCRSQMAEGWARSLLGDRIEAHSAGTVAKGLDPLAVAAMAEVGVDISQQESKELSELGNLRFDLVITVCAHADEHCPVFPGETVKVHRGFDDPPALTRNSSSQEEALAVYRRVRDEIRAFTTSLPDLIQEIRVP